MENPVDNKAGYGFGTAPVFLASVSTILGAILFLRFGYCVAHLGIFGALMIILIAHIITIPTGLAVAEIATNLKVEGGGEYYIISRSFGKTVGGGNRNLTSLFLAGNFCRVLHDRILGSFPAECLAGLRN